MESTCLSYKMLIFMFDLFDRCTNLMGGVHAAFIRQQILGNAVTSQHGALLSDDIKALKTNR